jgi:hypothetical protein
VAWDAALVEPALFVEEVVVVAAAAAVAVDLDCYPFFTPFSLSEY